MATRNPKANHRWDGASKPLYNMLAWTTVPSTGEVFWPDFERTINNMTYQSQAWENLMSGQPKPDVWPTNMLVGGKGTKQSPNIFWETKLKPPIFVQLFNQMKPPNHQTTKLSWTSCPGMSWSWLSVEEWCDSIKTRRCYDSRWLVLPQSWWWRKGDFCGYQEKWRFVSPKTMG